MGSHFAIFGLWRLILFWLGRQSRYTISELGSSICEESIDMVVTADLPPVLRSLKVSNSSEEMQLSLMARLAPLTALEYLEESNEQ